MSDDEKATKRRAEALISGESDELRQAKARIALQELEAEERAERDLPRLLAEERAEKPAREHREKWAAHKTAECEFELIAKRMGAKVPERRRKIAHALSQHEPGKVPPAKFSEVREEAAKLLAEDKSARKAAKLAKREKRTAGRLYVDEPASYGKNTDNSWFLDVMVVRDASLRESIARRVSTDMSPGAVEGRLRNHADDVREALRRKTSYGQRIEAQVRESCRWQAEPRGQDEYTHRSQTREAISTLRGLERRAVGTDGGITASATVEGAAFVSPAFLLKLFATYRGAVRAFANACASEPLPEYGMKIYLPYFSSVSSVTEQTEGVAVTESSPTTAQEGGTVETVAGRVVISEQLSERGFTGGYSFDKILGEQLTQQLNERVDKLALNAAISTGTVVAGNSGAYSSEKLYEDIAKAREEITGAAGTKLRPTHMFTSSNFFSYVTRQFDEQKRPFMPPTFAAGYPAATGADDFDSGGVPPWSRFSGAMMPGGVVWMEDDNIPTVGTTTGIQILVSAPAVSVLLMETTPLLQVFPQTLASSLESEVILRGYACAITRHSAGTAIISGNSYKNTLV
jgi:hypothetical protein